MIFTLLITVFPFFLSCINRNKISYENHSSFKDLLLCTSLFVIKNSLFC